MCRFFSIIYRKFWGNKMARPRKIEFAEGEILLKGFSPEKADEIEKLLTGTPIIVKGELDTGPIAPGSIIEIKPNEPIKEVDVTDLTFYALGNYHDKEAQQYKIVVIKYNPVTMLAKVEQIKNAGSFKLAAVNNMKMELVTLDLI